MLFREIKYLHFADFFEPGKRLYVKFAGRPGPLVSNQEYFLQTFTF
jgi:hypothetical protein